ncbi:MAG: 50S ribosomal protein L25 [Candidatus Yonathbacteria bacterium]|nr:50S ribosomal protein L25 [Candidatus Yonathbacteria bacterium]
MLTLNAEKRVVSGKGLEVLRDSGKIPAVAYGPKDGNHSIALNTIEFKKVWEKAGESSVISLKIGSEEKDALIHEVSVNPATDKIVHADLYLIEKGKSITVDVPLMFEGISPAVKNLGGVLVKVMHEVEVEAMPRDLPHELKVDISKLTSFEDQITVRDLVLPQGVKVTAGEDEIVALVSEPKEEVEEVAAATVADIEVVGAKGKKEEAGAEGEAKEIKVDASKGK